jgi:formylmethanofuran:tetrahydromethanopterin formyltransferase
MRKAALAFAAVLALPATTAVAFAQPPADKAHGGGAAAMAPPKPAPELQAFMRGSEGTWKCDTTMPAGSMGPGSPEMKNKSTIKIKKALDGFAYEGEWESKKTKEIPAMKGRFVMAWDGAAKQLVSTSYDTMGGVSTTMGAATAESATLTGNGSMMGQTMKVRQTIAITPDRKGMTHTFDADTGKGWQTMAKDECKK